MTVARCYDRGKIADIDAGFGFISFADDADQLVAGCLLS